MGIYDRTVKRMSKTAGLRWILPKILTPLDMRFKGTRFAPSMLGMDVPLCYLTTTGRRTETPRTVPLLFVIASDGNPAVAATNFGREHHPDWALNLETNPEAILEIDGSPQSVMAKAPSVPETTHLWLLFDGIWPGYETYRSMAPRNIKLFILERRDTK